MVNSKGSIACACHDVTEVRAFDELGHQKLIIQPMDDELEMGAEVSMHSWTMTALPGVPLPPNRGLHEKNNKKVARRAFSDVFSACFELG